MSVIVFLHHHTPSEPSGDYYDVPLTVFRDQIEKLVDSGISFIRFSEAQRHDYLSKGTQVSLTFDDGHISNLGAVEYLSTKGIIPTVFVVRRWAQQRSDYMSEKLIADLAPICEFGGHGASHTALTTIPDEALREELLSSRDFLEQVLSTRIDTMGLPGGAFDSRVVRMAHSCGYKLIGNSVFNINRRPSATLNRLTINRFDCTDYPRELAFASKFFWLRRSVRAKAVNSVRRLMGDEAYRIASQKTKRGLALMTRRNRITGDNNDQSAS